MKFILLESNKNKSDIILYHNTPYSNVESIQKHGLLVKKSNSERISGFQFTWATTHPLKDDAYGGCTIKFKLPKDYDYEQVNDDQYVIYQDIEPELIESIDILIGSGGTGYMHQSDVQEYIDEYGKEKVKKVIIKHHNRLLSDEDVKRLTPELDWGMNESVGTNDFRLPDDNDIKNGNASFCGMNIVYTPSEHFEARNNDTYIEVSDKFFNLSDGNKLFVLVHEVAHNVADDIMENDFDGASEDGIFVTKKVFIKNGNTEENNNLFDELNDIDDKVSNWQKLKLDKTQYRNLMQRREEIVAKLGGEPRIYFEGIYGEIQNALGETLADTIAQYYLNAEELKAKHPRAYKYIDSWMKSGKSKMWSR